MPSFTELLHIFEMRNVSLNTRMLTIAVFFTAIFIASASIAQDATEQGSYAVSYAEYDVDNSDFKPSKFPFEVEVAGSVHYPTDITQGPFPLIVFMHGRTDTCYSATNSSLDWPCPTGMESIPSYKGFDYISSVLASHGYIVISISANGISAKDNNMAGGINDDAGISVRAELIEHHLTLWGSINKGEAGPFGDLFKDQIDLNNIGAMGHSKGADGVAAHYIHNREIDSPYTINAVLAITSSNLHRQVVDNVHLGTVLSYCDGDTVNFMGARLFDDARHNTPADESAKHSFLIMGANHNFYNTVWTPGLFPHTPRDDWHNIDDPHCGKDSDRRLSADEQRAIALTITTAFFRNYLGGESQFLDFLMGDEKAPGSSGTEDYFISYHPPASNVLNVNTLDSSARIHTNTLGDESGEFGLSDYEICGEENRCLPSVYYLIDPYQDINQLKASWHGNAWYRNILPPAYRDVSNHDVLQLRVGVNFIDSPENLNQDFHIQLRDAQEQVSSVRVSEFSNALYYPPGATKEPMQGYYLLPVTLLNTVRIPLSAFTGIDVTNITEIRLEMGESNQGSILVSDIAFTTNHYFDVDLSSGDGKVNVYGDDGQLICDSRTPCLSRDLHPHRYGELTFEAVADPIASFSHWENSTCSDLTCDVFIGGSSIIPKAIFNILTTEITLNMRGDGFGIVEGSQLNRKYACNIDDWQCKFTVLKNGGLVKLDAIIFGDLFNGWSGVCSGTNLTCNVDPALGNQTVTADFPSAWER